MHAGAEAWEERWGDFVLLMGCGLGMHDMHKIKGCSNLFSEMSCGGNGIDVAEKCKGKRKRERKSKRQERAGKTWIIYRALPL